MKRMISIFLAVAIIIISIPINTFAAISDEEYYSAPVQYSDNTGRTEHLNFMINDDNLYVDAKMLSERMGFTFGENEDGFIITNIDSSYNLPYSITKFNYASKQVSHTIFNQMIDAYEAPFASVKNEKGFWAPFQFMLHILNSGHMIPVENGKIAAGSALQIDMPNKRIIDYMYDLVRKSDEYSFEWADDFGYTDGDLKTLNKWNHLINVYNGVLEVDGESWVSAFQVFSHNTSAYDKKYGEQLAILLCTESDKEFQSSAEKIEAMCTAFSDDGDLGEALANTSRMYEIEVGRLSEQCETILENVRAGNSPLLSYNRSYQALEKALDHQTRFSNTGGIVLDIQKDVSEVAGSAFSILEFCTQMARIVGYYEEFKNQDTFALEAIKKYLNSPESGSQLTQTMKSTMNSYTSSLSGSIEEYGTKRFWDEMDHWLVSAVEEGVPLYKIIGSQAATALMVWNIASSTIPYISNGLSAADNFELAEYAQILQADSYLNYLNRRNTIFGKNGNITSRDMYNLSMYCYIYLKSCYITREAALASLASKRKSVKEKIQPLVDYQNNINEEIAGIMVELKAANETNEYGVYGYLPDDSVEFDDSRLLEWIKLSADKKKTDINLKTDIDYEYLTALLCILDPFENEEELERTTPDSPRSKLISYLDYGFCVMPNQGGHYYNTNIDDYIIPILFEDDQYIERKDERWYSDKWPDVYGLPEIYKDTVCDRFLDVIGSDLNPEKIVYDYNIKAEYPLMWEVTDNNIILYNQGRGGPLNMYKIDMEEPIVSEDTVTITYYKEVYFINEITSQDTYVATIVPTDNSLGYKIQSIQRIGSETPVEIKDDDQIASPVDSSNADRSAEDILHMVEAFLEERLPEDDDGRYSGGFVLEETDSYVKLSVFYRISEERYNEIVSNGGMPSISRPAPNITVDRETGEVFEEVLAGEEKSIGYLW